VPRCGCGSPNAYGRTSEGRIWALVSGDGEVAYRFTRTPAASGPAEMFKSFRGHLHVDAYAGYDALFRDGTRIDVECWAHARRYSYDARDCAPDEAAHALGVIQRLYAVVAARLACRRDRAPNRLSSTQ